jgi:Ni,Fe-hydrogenase III large subunit
VTGPRWLSAPPEGFALGPDRAPAYFAPDGSLSLYNDYHDGRSILVPGGPAAEAAEVAATWRPGPAPGPLAPRRTVEGYGTFTFPYGPISMGVPEAGRFDVATYGERILELTPLGGYKSRRVLGSIVGARVEDAALRIERLAGNVSASHVAAFLAAAESAQEVCVPEGELWVRALAQELQRIYNHVHLLARLADAASQNVGAAQSHALAEELLRLQARHFGHRWLFGALLPGGPGRRLEPADRRELSERLRLLGREFDLLWQLFLESRTFVDRLQGTGVVPRSAAVRWGAVGPTLRASGVAWDDRLRVPEPPYTDLFVAVPHEKDGDALSRLLVRGHETRGSLLLLEQMLDRWPAGSGEPIPAAPAVTPGRGLGRVEGPSGDVVYEVRLAAGRLASVGLRSPSRANWPVFAEGMRNAVFTDFHFAFESFGMVFAETDG